MIEKYCESNQAKIGGVVVSEIVYSHEVFTEKFYIFDLETTRDSNNKDIIKVIISERLVDINLLKEGTEVYIEGQFRSYNQSENGKRKLLLSVFAKNIKLDNFEKNNKNINEVILDGFICKEPIYRETPLGREIADVLMAVNRTFERADYIPCILWGRNAKFTSTMKVGTHLKITGRMQSRMYEKKYPNGNVEKKVAYEVSVAKCELLDLTKENKDFIME